MLDLYILKFQNPSPTLFLALCSSLLLRLRFFFATVSTGSSTCLYGLSTLPRYNLFFFFATLGFVVFFFFFFLFSFVCLFGELVLTARMFVCVWCKELVCGSRGSSKELVCRRCPGLFGVLTLHSVWGAHSCSQGVIFSEVIQIDLCPLNA